MRYLDLITTLNHLTQKQEAVVQFKALRQDPFIWKEFQQLTEDSPVTASLTRQGMPLNPGTLTVLLYDPGFDFSTLNARVTSREKLEKLMFGYEEYIQGDKPPATLAQVGGLALALLEKRKTAASWADIIQEIVTRMKINHGDKFLLLWGTVFVVATNLVEDKDSCFRDLTIFQQAEISVEIFTHLVLCLPRTEQEKVEVLRCYLYPLSPQIQVTALKQLKKTSDGLIYAQVASKILEKYQPPDSPKKSTGDYWKNPVSSMHYAFQCQSVADIAQLAGNTAVAVDLNEKALEVISALLKMSKVKKADIHFDAAAESIPLAELFSTEELADPEILAELAYTSAAGDLQLSGESATAKIMQQAKKMTKPGNVDLARAELQENLKLLSESEFERLLADGPEHIQSWEPVTLLTLLVESGAYDEAERLGKVLLARNPSSEPVNAALAAAAEGKGDHTAALGYLETLNALDPGSVGVMRKLADAQIRGNAYDAAYQTYSELIDQADLPEEKDLNRFGEIALMVGKVDEALTAATEILGRNPDSARGLTLAGMAHHRKGQDAAAIDELRRAIALAEGEVKPWIELAEIAWTGGDHSSSLTTLKEGMAANPGNSELQSVYAQRLMDEGLVSEAFPYLLELSVKGHSAEVDLQLVAAMKQLGMENIDETIAGFVNRYPGDHRFIGEYGSRLVWKGEQEKGLGYLKSIADHLKEDTVWSMAYLEGVLQPDHVHLVSLARLAKSELIFTKELLDDLLIREPDNLHAKMLKAEWLLQSGEYTAARKSFDAIMDESQGGRDLPSARLFAGLAQSAAQNDEHEIAMAALEQAITLQPSWYGLLRLKAEFLNLSGDMDEAVKQAESALEVAPDHPENHVWLIEFTTALGRTGNLEKHIKSAVTQYPDHLGLRLLQAQNRIGIETDEESLDIEKALLALIDKTDDADALIKAAVIFSNLGNPEKTISCLEKAAAQGSSQAQLSLAGLYRMSGELEKALSVLESVQPTTGMTELFKREAAFTHSGEGTRLDIDPDEPVRPMDVMIEEAFLPMDWKELLDSSRPEIVLKSRIAMTAGNPEELISDVRDWINAEPENLEARLYGIETALACCSQEDYQRFLDEIRLDPKHLLAGYFNLLKSERELDDGTLVRDDPVEGDIFDSVSVGEPEKISFIRLLANEGNYAAAETSLEMAINVFSEVQAFPFIEKIGILRNLAKSAAALERWPEALQLGARATGLVPSHHAIRLMHLKHQALAQEMVNRTESLGVERHCDLSDHNVPAPDNAEMERITNDWVQEETHRWVLRYQLAKEPTRENIRELALLTPTAEDVAALASALRRIGQSRTALQVAKKFAEHPLVMFEQCVCTAENDVPKALEILERSLRIQPLHPLSLRLRADLLERTGNLTEAAESLAQALELWPNEYRWHVKFAELWQRLGNAERPVESLRLANLYAQDEPEIQEKLGQALLRNEKPDEALKYLLAAVEKQPDRPDLWLSISEAHQQSGDLDLALEAAERAVQVDPYAVKARLQAGKVRWERGEIEKALDQVNLAISLDADDAASYVLMAQLLNDQGDKSKALQMLEKATQSKNADVQVLVEHASLLKDIKGASAARDLIASFSDKYPENPELLRLLAEAEDQCGNIKKAEMVAKKALAIQPEEVDLQMLLGKIQEKVGNLDQAVSYFSQAIALEPRRKEAYLLLSQVYLKQRDHLKARQALEQGITKNPGELDLYLACAALLKEAKDYQAAEQMLRKASSLEPRNVNIHRQLGAVLALNLVHQSQEVSSQP